MEMRQAAVATAPTARACPICGQPVVPDALGLIECGCGWGGPGDPLESARGLSKTITQLDRRLASGQARRELARMRQRPGQPIRTGALYTFLLAFAATLVYLLVLALVAGSLALVILGVAAGAWIEVAVGVILLAWLALSLVPSQRKAPGVEATPQRFPSLAAAIAEAATHVGGPTPDRVRILPGIGFSVAQHRPARRLFRRELVLHVGAATLPILTDVEVKAILTHELAHYAHGDTGLIGYFVRAEHALTHMVTTLSEGAQSNTGMRRGRGRSGISTLQFGSYLVYLITLPLGIALVGYHLLRLRQSRGAEFEADRVAARAYGAHALINGLSAHTIAHNTLRHSGSRLASAGNYYAAAREHYASLPANVLGQLRQEAIRGYRTLQSTHPITPDRLRAAYIISPQTVSAPPPNPASTLLVPAGEPTAATVERELTALLIKR